MLSCTDQEIIISKPSPIEKAQSPTTLGVQSNFCDYKSWDNMITGSYGTVPYTTPINTTLSNIQGQPAYSVKSYNITVNFQNNSANLLQLYYNGVAVGGGFFTSGSTKTITFTNTCTCATGLCPRTVSIPYTWTVQKISGNGPYSQIIMTTTVASPHVLNSGSATIVFN